MLTPVDNPTAYGLVETDARRQRRAVPREAGAGRDPLQHDQRRHLRARARHARSHPEGHRLVDRAQLLPVAHRAPRDVRRLRLPTATGSTSARRRSTCRCTATSWTAVFAAPPFDGAPETAWIAPGARIEDGVAIDGPCFIDDGAVVKAGARIAALLRHRPADARRRGARSSKASILWPNSWVGREATVRGSIVGPQLPRRPQRASRDARSSLATSPSSPTTAGYDHQSRSIFKAYDVRGLYPSEINEDAARAIGRGFVSYLQAKRIAVSPRHAAVVARRSPRRSSTARANRAPTSSTTACCATDMMYFAVVRDELDGGVQITASHNPKQYNGIKMVRREAFPL